MNYVHSILKNTISMLPPCIIAHFAFDSRGFDLGKTCNLIELAIAVCIYIYIYINTLRIQRGIGASRRFTPPPPPLLEVHGTKLLVTKCMPAWGADLPIYLEIAHS